jgi:hypothetical protein
MGSGTGSATALDAALDAILRDADAGDEPQAGPPDDGRQGGDPAGDGQ